MRMGAICARCLDLRTITVAAGRASRRRGRKGLLRARWRFRCWPRCVGRDAAGGWEKAGSRLAFLPAPLSPSVAASCSGQFAQDERAEEENELGSRRFPGIIAAPTAHGFHASPVRLIAEVGRGVRAPLGSMGHSRGLRSFGLGAVRSPRSGPCPKDKWGRGANTVPVLVKRAWSGDWYKALSREWCPYLARPTAGRSSRRREREFSWR